jgi:hypothetical protein
VKLRLYLYSIETFLNILYAKRRLFLKLYLSEKKERAMEKDTKKFKKLITTFEELLSEEKIKEIAIECGVADKRVRELPIYPFTLLMILGQGLGLELCLKKLCELAINWELTVSGNLSDERISQQVKERGYEYFKMLFNHLLKIALNLPRRSKRKIIKEFKKINIIDSTTINLFSKLVVLYKGTKGQSALKLHVRLNLIKGIPEEVNLSPAKEHDNPHALYEDSIIENILYIMDLGYTDYDRYKELKDRGDHFVVRVKSNAIIKIIEDLSGKHPEYKGCNLSWVLKEEGGEELDVLVELSNGLHIRLVRVWEEKANKYYTYLTTLTDNKKWKIQEIRDLYKLRWAIEILFRDIKRVLGCFKIIFRTEIRIKAQIYAALCYYLLIRIFILISAHQNKHEIEQYSIKYCSLEIRKCIVGWYRYFKRCDRDIMYLVNMCLIRIKQKGLKSV